MVERVLRGLKPHPIRITGSVPLYSSNKCILIGRGHHHDFPCKLQASNKQSTCKKGGQKARGVRGAHTLHTHVQTHLYDCLPLLLLWWKTRRRRESAWNSTPCIWVLLIRRCSRCVPDLGGVALQRLVIRQAQACLKHVDIIAIAECAGRRKQIAS